MEHVTPKGVLGYTGTTMTSLMFFFTIYKRRLPNQLQNYIEKIVNKMMGSVSIKFNEYTGENLQRSEMYDSIRHYLASNSTARAQRLKANESRNTRSLVLSMDDDEEVEDVFEGVKVKWSSSVKKSRNETNEREKRYFMLTFHKRHRGMIVERYIEHVRSEGRETRLRNRERKLYTNNLSRWGNVPFNHPATFETLAMDPWKKEEIKKDLIRFGKAKDYYKRVGKPWNRGYLLFGPPGTGKSTMISAMANFLEYDVCDLELTTVKDNSELKRLLLETTGKCIVVIEDIDCSFTGPKREKKEEQEVEKKKKKDEPRSKITLSGLLNSIDGLWSACSDEKIMVFTTNFVDNLDPALRGRMDNHIEMSYCRFEAFKVLAKNYLETEAHELYGEIEILLEETDMSPADVAENLMPKSDEEDVDICLKSLEEEKEKARKLAEEEEKKKLERGAEKKKKEGKQRRKK